MFMGREGGGCTGKGWEGVRVGIWGYNGSRMGIMSLDASRFALAG